MHGFAEHRRACAALVLGAVLLAGCRTARPPAAAPATATRTRAWARPVRVDGVPNLFRVSDRLYRSAQPSREGFRGLRRLGIVTIVDLRSFHSDRFALRGTGLRHEHIWMKPWHPEDDEAERFLRIVTDPRRTPALVHCQKGADRTGAVVALYRIVVEGWSPDEALLEMRSGGFGFHEAFANIEPWIRGLDAAALRRAIAPGGAGAGPRSSGPGGPQRHRATGGGTRGGSSSAGGPVPHTLSISA